MIFNQINFHIESLGTNEQNNDDNKKTFLTDFVFMRFKKDKKRKKQTKENYSNKVYCKLYNNNNISFTTCNPAFKKKTLSNLIDFFI